MKRSIRWLVGSLILATAGGPVYAEAAPGPLPLGALEPAAVEGDLAVDRAANGQVLNIGELTYPSGLGKRWNRWSGRAFITFAGGARARSGRGGLTWEATRGGRPTT
jgi:hypothetical protein